MDRKKGLTCRVRYAHIHASSVRLFAGVSTFPKWTSGLRLSIAARNLDIDTTLKGGICAATVSLSEPDPLDS